jgi:hypothetical protein
VELIFAITENNKDIERRPDEQKATAINIYPQKGRKFYFQHVSHLMTLLCLNHQPYIFHFHILDMLGL